MLTDAVPGEVMESTSLPADVTDDDSCRLEFIEIVPLTRDTGGLCTTECDSGDWSGEVKQENLPGVKQEPEEVCYTGLIVTECDCEDSSGEVEQENLPVVKQEPEEVCYTGLLVTEYDSGDWSGEVKQENLPVVKQEPEEVCYTGLLVTE